MSVYDFEGTAIYSGTPSQCHAFCESALRDAYGVCGNVWREGNRWHVMCGVHIWYTIR